MTLPFLPLPNYPGRRRVLRTAAATAAAVPLAACQGEPSARPTDERGEPAEVDPDEVLLAAAARLESQMVAMLRPLLADGPDLLRRTAQVHRAHLDLLEQPGQDELAPAPGARLRVSGIAAAEERLARRHAEAAVRASSGPFARVLAGMSASAAQQADVWRRQGARG